MIKNLKHFFETQTSLLKKKAGIFKEENIECTIDEQLVDCKEIDKDPYVGVPAPIVTPIDDWFSEPVININQQDYMERETEIKKQETAFIAEPENIHEILYEIATQNSSTTLQIDPIGGSEIFQGGSENVHQ
tara:strand:- start:494 stop:889 length:396 start_codon:yes stop_codon:yes gene_type:complete